MSPLPISRPIASNVTPWPTLKQALAIKQTSRLNIGRFIKTIVALLLARRFKLDLTAVFRAQPWAAQLFIAQPQLFRTVLDQFMDSRSTMRDRFSMVASGLRFVDKCIDPNRMELIIAGKRMTIWCADDLGLFVDFGINDLTPQEGFFSLVLRQIDSGAMIYFASFSVVQDSVTIGALQGARGEDGLAVMRQVTRSLYGVRPQYFLIEILRSVTSVWGLGHLIGVDGNNQIKANKSSKNNAQVMFDYNAFWAELGGERNARGNWVLPSQGKRKTLEEVESKKRAMYRRRFSMLDAVIESVQRSLGPAANC